MSAQALEVFLALGLPPIPMQGSGFSGSPQIVEAVRNIAVEKVLS